MKSILFGLGVVLLFSGCFKEPTVDCSYDACALKAPSSEIQAVREYLITHDITDTTLHCSGLFYSIESAGTGKTPDLCSRVTARYKGYLTNGTVFDETTTQEGVVFSLSQVVRGWANGIPLIKAGGRIRLYIPPSLGYGSQNVVDPQTGQVIIPGNSILIFEVDLVAVQ